MCKFDSICERDFCMFKHKTKDVTETIIECEDIQNHDADFEPEVENDSFNKTFVNPSQDITRENTFKCEACDFTAVSKDDVNKHKTVIHNWCDICFSSFVTQERLNLHLKKKHNKMLKTD